jgi:hypothetical protein
MESNARSPIFSEFGELLAGVVTVRGWSLAMCLVSTTELPMTAFSAEKRFLDNLHAKIDTTSKMGYAFALFFASVHMKSA